MTNIRCGLDRRMSITKEEICEKFDYSTAQNVKHEVFEKYHVRQKVGLKAKSLRNLIYYLHKAKC